MGDSAVQFRIQVFDNSQFSEEVFQKVKEKYSDTEMISEKELSSTDLSQTILIAFDESPENIERLLLFQEFKDGLDFVVPAIYVTDKISPPMNELFSELELMWAVSNSELELVISRIARIAQHFNQHFSDLESRNEGQQFFKVGNLEDAVKCFEAISENYTHRNQLFIKIAKAYAFRGERGKSRKYLDRVELEFQNCLSYSILQENIVDVESFEKKKEVSLNRIEKENVFYWAKHYLLIG